MVTVTPETVLEGAAAVWGEALFWRGLSGEGAAGDSVWALTIWGPRMRTKAHAAPIRSLIPRNSVDTSKSYSKTKLFDPIIGSRPNSDESFPRMQSLAVGRRR